MTNIILGTKTIDVGDQAQGSKMYYLADCGSSCQNVEIKVTMSSGDPDLFGKVNGRPEMSGEYSCGNCECSSAYDDIFSLLSFLYNLRSSIYTGMYLFFFFSQATGQTDQCTVNDDGSWISILVSGHSDYTGAQLEVTNVHEVYSPQGEGELNAKCKYIPRYFRLSNKV